MKATVKCIHMSAGCVCMCWCMCVYTDNVQVTVLCAVCCVLCAVCCASWHVSCQKCVRVCVRAHLKVDGLYILPVCHLKPEAET